jgi:hypothetical protein
VWELAYRRAGASVGAAGTWAAPSEWRERARGGARELAVLGKCWAAGAERTHGHEQAMLECDVPSNGTRRMSCGGKLLREM